MRIRKFMVIGVLAVIVFPWIVYGFIHVIDTFALQQPSGIHRTNLTQVMRTIAQNEHNWTHPDWQRRLAAELEHQGLNAEIRSPSNKVIFQSGRGFHEHWMSTSQLVVMNNGKLVGTVQLSVGGSADPIAAIGSIVACVLAIVFVSVQVGRNVIKPLESMSHAALQIADGDLDLELASSNTVEIRQVSTAFQVMVKGLRDAFAKQQKLEEERKFFIGAIAHDLRTPLFALRGYLDGMEQGIVSSPERIAHYVAVCKEKAAHLDRLVSDLFAFTRLEYMEQTLQKERFDLFEVINATVASMMHRAEDKEIVLDTNTSNGECVIFGDSHLMKRAITNLLDNAIRHTPKQGKVTVDLQRYEEKLVVKIKDTGPGFSARDLSHIFEPMYRGDASRNAFTGGAGLGLTIARRVFRSHGGDLFAENSPGGGAMLTGMIPSNSPQVTEG